VKKEWYSLVINDYDEIGYERIVLKTNGENI